MADRPNHDNSDTRKPLYYLALSLLTDAAGLVSDLESGFILASKSRACAEAVQAKQKIDAAREKKHPFQTETRWLLSRVEQTGKDKPWGSIR